MALYKVKSDGKAPAGLSVGDEVLTGGGTYRITGVNRDGSYQSVLSDKNQTTYNTSVTAARNSSLLTGGVSDYTLDKVNALESGYRPSAAVQAAQDYLSGVQKNKPGVYDSRWSSQLDELYNKIVNRDTFTYDLGTDVLYNQYKNQYRNLGQMAMMDTMGQAAALTGGYGSSYGQSVGQQTYDAYLQKLNDVVPELYAQALNQYNAEGAELYNQYDLLNSREQADYGAYRDAMSDYYNDLNNAQNAYNSALTQDYRQYADQLDYWAGKMADENSAYAADLALQQKNAVKTGQTAKKTGSQKKTEEKKTENQKEEKELLLSTSAQEIVDRVIQLREPAEQLEFLKRAKSGGTITASEEKKILTLLGLS